MPNNQVYISPSDFSNCYVTCNDGMTICGSKDFNSKYYTLTTVEDTSKIKQLEDEIVTLKEVISDLLNKQKFEE